MEVTAARRFSPKSEQPQTVSSTFITKEASEKTAAASDERGNIKKKKKSVLHVALLCFQKNVGDNYFKKIFKTGSGISLVIEKIIILSTSFSLEIT